MKPYGKELILDLHGCNTQKFNRKSIKEYFRILCDEKINMERCDLHWWDYKDYPEEYVNAPAHLKGTSAIQFIKTSNITIHALDVSGNIYLNIFSCKDFDVTEAQQFTLGWFCGKIVQRKVINRL